MWRFWSGTEWTEFRHPRDPAHALQYVSEGGVLPLPATLPRDAPSRAADLRANVPGQSVIEKLVDLERQGRRAEQRSWYTGLVGERHVAGLLAQLGPEWTVLHSVPVGTEGSDIDHVLIGPPGVFTINTKHHPGGRVWVAGHGLRVNNQQQHYLTNAAHEASRAERVLTKASGTSVEVVGIIAVVGATVTVKAPPHSDSAQIGVVPASALLSTVQVRRAYSDEQIARIVAAATKRETWTSSAPSRQTDATALLADFAPIEARILHEVAAERRAPRPRRAARAQTARPRPTPTRSGSGCGTAVLALLGAMTVAAVMLFGVTVVLPAVFRGLAANSQAQADARAEMVELTAAAEHAASTLDEATAGGPRPAAMTITPGDALLVTDAGVVIADLPDGTTGTYTASADGLSYSLTLVAPEYGSTVTVTPEQGVVAVPD